MNCRFQQLQNSINLIEFFDCKDIKMGDVFHYSFKEKISDKEILNSIIRIIRNCFFNRIEYNIKGIPKTIMLYSSSYRERKEHFDAFNKVCLTLSDYVEFFPGKIKVSSNIKSLKNCFIWGKQLKKTGIDWREKIYLVSVIQQAYCDYYIVEKTCKNNNFFIKNGVTLCDVMPIDSFFVQKWKSLGLRTITLQHGTFNVGHYGYASSISDYFFAHSEFSVVCAVKSGLDRRKIVVVGAPQNINIERNYDDSNYKIIGVVLGGTILEKYDIQLLQMINVFAQKYGFKVYAKFHPGFPLKKYSESIEEYIDKEYYDEISCYEFMKFVDFLVDDGSTVFIECLQNRKVAFTYLCEINPYKYDKNIFLTFESYDEMEKLFCMYIDNSEEIKYMIEQNIKYLGTKENPFELYKQAFENYLI